MATYKETVLADSPLVYYRIDDAGSEIEGAAKDEGTLKQNGVYKGVVKLTEGALSGPGNTDQAGSWVNNDGNYIRVANSVGLEALTEAFTFEQWVFPLVAGEAFRTIIDKTNVAEEENAGVSLLVSTGGTKLATTAFGTFFPTAGTLIAGAWNYVVMTYNNVKFVWYVNSVKTSESTKAGPTAAFAGPTKIGSRFGNTAQPFNGGIDEVAIYNVALSQTQINKHFFAANPEPEVAPSGATPRAGHKHPAIRVGALA